MHLLDCTTHNPKVPTKILSISYEVDNIGMAICYLGFFVRIAEIELAIALLPIREKEILKLLRS